MTQSRMVVHRFPGWEIRPLERVVLVDGKPARLGSRAFDLLVALAQRPGRLVNKRELMELAWPGVVVEENNLSVQILALRRLLGAQAIVNVAGHGYQLACLPSDAPPQAPLTAPAPAVATVPPPLPEPGPAPAPGPAPVGTMLWGREADLQALSAMVGAHPLVSLVGTGGVGKTALARALVNHPMRQLRDGTHWIDLAPLRPGDRLLPLVAQALGVLTHADGSHSDEPVRALAPLQALIVLDNCEHMLDEVARMLAPLLQGAPGLHWLATSQEPLHVEGETVYRLLPLQTPLPGADAGAALRNGAVALFCARARAADRRFELTPERTAMAVDLCRQLDGLPLALEMAAARVATLGLHGVHDQIGQRLKLRASLRGAPARHHTLQQTYEWSYGLLTPVEQCVFRRLEPFVGGFTAQTAQQLCCVQDGPGPALDTWEMLDALSALVDKSLVQRGEPAAPGASERLWLLESARDFARLQLERAGELQAVRRRHAQVVAEVFSNAQHELQHWRDREWADKYLPERNNVCAALAWAGHDGEPEVLARLAAALAQMDALTHTQAEVVRLKLPMDRLAAAPLAWRARARLELGWAQFLDGHRELGTELTQGALADFEALGDTVGVYAALTRLTRLYAGRPGMEAQAREMWARLKLIDESRVPLRLRLTCHSTVALFYEGGRSVERLEELCRLATHAGFDAEAAVCRMNISDELLLQGRFDEVVEATGRMLDEGEPLLRGRAAIHYNRAHALVQLGRIAEAQASSQATLRALPAFVHLVMDLFALVAVRHGRHADAAWLAGCSARIKRERDLHTEASEVALIAETLQQLDIALGPARAQQLMAQGALMNLDDVLALAFQDFASTGPTVPA